MEIKVRDVLVVGGGIVGLAVAREVAKRGARVTLLERDRPAGQATWAAAGMLAPMAEAPRPDPFLGLALESLGLYPAFASALEEESGLEVGFRRTGKLLVALDADGEARLGERLSWQRTQGVEVRSARGGELAALEPGLAPDVRSALHFPDDAIVDSRALGRAAWRAAVLSGVRVSEGTAASDVVVSGGRARGVRLRGGETLGGEAVVVAAGAWSGGLGGLPRPLPVRPVLGQMIALGPNEPVSRHVVADGEVYVIPRTVDGAPRVWVGATMEEAGWAKTTTPAARERLRQAAARLLPALGEAPVVDQWAGLRPGTPDGLPVLGPDPEIGGLHYATGHFRNGILLAPVTARVLADLIVGDGAEGLEPYRADRFGPQT